jgi:hypothetical protein
MVEDTIQVVVVGATISWIRVAVMTRFQATLHLDVRESGACFLRHLSHKTRVTALKLRRFKFR